MLAILRLILLSDWGIFISYKSFIKKNPQKPLIFCNFNIPKIKRI